MYLPLVFGRSAEKTVDTRAQGAQSWLARGATTASKPRIGNMQQDDREDPQELLAELDLGGPAPARPDNTSERPRGPRIVGAPTKSHFIEYSRDLTEADLTALDAPRGNVPRSLVRIHSSHHSLAKCLAVGMKHSQASLVTGYSQVRISQLQNDPAFMALVADYREESKSVVTDLTQRLIGLSLDAMELLHERLLEDPQGFTIPVLLDIVKATADRTGHGPGQEMSVRHTVDFIDRPPRETAEEWHQRRQKELLEGANEGPINASAMKRLN
jgi:hypothetical protein